VDEVVRFVVVPHRDPDGLGCDPVRLQAVHHTLNLGTILKQANNVLHGVSLLEGRRPSATAASAASCSTPNQESKRQATTDETWATRSPLNSDEAQIGGVNHAARTPAAVRGDRLRRRLAEPPVGGRGTRRAIRPRSWL